MIECFCLRKLLTYSIISMVQSELNWIVSDIAGRLHDKWQCINFFDEGNALPSDIATCYLVFSFF